MADFISWGAGGAIWVGAAATLFCGLFVLLDPHLTRSEANTFKFLSKCGFVLVFAGLAVKHF
jgi:hypothetical protein